MGCDSSTLIIPHPSALLFDIFLSLVIRSLPFTFSHNPICLFPLSSYLLSLIILSVSFCHYSTSSFLLLSDLFLFLVIIQPLLSSNHPISFFPPPRLKNVRTSRFSLREVIPPIVKTLTFL